MNNLEKLRELLKDYPWLIAIGEGTVTGKDKTYIVYVSCKTEEVDHIIPSEWEGTPVYSRRMLKPKAQVDYENEW